MNPCSGLSCVSDALCVYSGTTGYQCMCGIGLVGDGREAGSGCSDPPEGCSRPSSACAGHATCTVVNGTYSCACQPGYSGDGFRQGSGCTSRLTVNSQWCNNLISLAGCCI